MRRRLICHILTCRARAATVCRAWQQHLAETRLLSAAALQPDCCDGVSVQQSPLLQRWMRLHGLQLQEFHQAEFAMIIGVTRLVTV